MFCIIYLTANENVYDFELDVQPGTKVNGATKGAGRRTTILKYLTDFSPYLHIYCANWTDSDDLFVLAKLFSISIRNIGSTPILP